MVAPIWHNVTAGRTEGFHVLPAEHTHDVSNVSNIVATRATSLAPKGPRANPRIKSIITVIYAGVRGVIGSARVRSSSYFHAKSYFLVFFRSFIGKFSWGASSIFLSPINLTGYSQPARKVWKSRQICWIKKTRFLIASSVVEGVCSREAANFGDEKRILPSIISLDLHSPRNIVCILDNVSLTRIIRVFRVATECTQWFVINKVLTYVSSQSYTTGRPS